MQAGRLRHRVTFSRPLDDRHDATDNPGQWQPVLSVDADIRPVSIREIEAAQGLLMQTDSVVECRWRPELADVNNQWLIESAFFTEPCRVLTAFNPDYLRCAWRVTCRAQSLFEGLTEDSP